MGGCLDKTAAIARSTTPLFPSFATIGDAPFSVPKVRIPSASGITFDAGLCGCGLDDPESAGRHAFALRRCT